MPASDFKITDRNRFVRIDPTRYEQEGSQDTIVKMYQENTEAYEEQGFAELLQYFSKLVQVLKTKGSRVYVLRLPSEGTVLDYERQQFPQDRFWNLMRRYIDARFIHFEDFFELNGYMSADGSHVDTEKAGEFTGKLALVLSANGL